MRLPVEITHLTLVVTRAGMSSGRATTPDLTFDEDGLAGIDSIPIGHGRTAWRRQVRSPDEACASNAFPECFQPPNALRPPPRRRRLGPRCVSERRRATRVGTITKRNGMHSAAAV